MRVTPNQEPRRRRPNFRVRPWMIAIVVTLIALYVFLRLFASTWTDYLWYNELGFSATWRELILARWIPAIVFTVLFFVVLLSNLIIADRIAPAVPTTGPEDEVIERYRQFVGPWIGKIRIAIAALFALILGVGVSSEWKEWILFTNAQSFHKKDPQFGMDIGFYVFKLPFLQFIVSWAFAGLVIVLLITAIAHYLNGGIRFQEPFSRVTPQVKAHLSLILGAMALVKTAEYYLGRFELDFSNRGTVTGAGATDVRAQLPALNLLMVISVAAAILFLVNIRRRGFTLPIVAVGLWAFVSLVIGTIFPALYQQFEVKPNELSAEKPYIARNIQATRDAFNLSNVAVQSFNYSANLNPAIIENNSQTVNNARLWDTATIQTAYQNLQKLGTFYQFRDVDVDRYEVGGRTQQVLISARELNQAELPSQSWVNRNLVYTHGYGLVVSPTNSARSDGNPNYLLNNIPATGKIKLTQPEIYFGDGLDGYALVDTKAQEYNYSSNGTQHNNSYGGSGGVKLDSYAKRLAFALKFGDFNLAISGQITNSTKILLNRDVKARANAIAPFLAYDHDPYPVIANGRTYWILDAYTTTDRYPYAQSPSGASFNYERNSVKVVLDAYNGTMKFYVVDNKDPIIKAYQSAFPGLFTAGSKMPLSIRAHLRYPEDIFTNQTSIYASYHVTDPTDFYQNSAKWEVAPDPSQQTGSAGGTANTPAAAGSGNTNRIKPYYLLIRLPGHATEDFLILRPFVPVSNNQLTNLVSFMVAKSDPSDYGQLDSYVMPTGQNVPGPSQASSAISKDPAISKNETLLGGSGSTLSTGDMQLIPIGNSIVYVRPEYITNTLGQKYPAFSFVTVFYNGNAVYAATVHDALVQLGIANATTNGSTTTTTAGGTTPTNPNTNLPPIDAAAQSLLNQAAQKFKDADAALTAGKLGLYQTDLDSAQSLVNQAIAELNKTVNGTTSTTSTTKAKSSAGTTTTTAKTQL
jgi:uncharacterized membrane protein (UPF0182 family)